MNKLLVNTTNKDFVFGDFDHDGIKNIDDKFPLNKKKNQQVSEVKLSDELIKLKHAALSLRKKTFAVYKHIRAHGYRAKFRVKSVNSIINKLRRKRLNSIKDLGGVLILTKNPQQSYDAAEFIKSNYKTLKEDYEDYYKEPLKKYYKAIHLVILVDDKPIEIQIKSKKEHRIHLRAHPYYKNEKLSEKHINNFSKEVTDLYRKEDW